MTLKVLTLNLWNRMGPYEKRKARIRHWVDELDPDVIGFQEVMRGEGFDQLGELLEDSPFETDFTAATQWDGMDFGNAIATRWPITNREELELPTGGNDETRSALSVTIDAPFGELSFTVTHLNWKLHHGHVREQQVLALTDLILRRRPRGGFPPIVVGDFNAEPDSAEIRFMRGFQSLDGRSALFYDAWSVAGDGGPGCTWSNQNDYAAVALEPERRIDYILAGYPIRMTSDHGVGHIERCHVVCNDVADGIWPSDHFGVYAEFRTVPMERPRFDMG